MVKGFASLLPTGNKAQLKPELPLTSINEIQASLLTYLQDIPDPRVSRTQKHLLTDILVIAILAVIAGAEGWEDMENGSSVCLMQWTGVIRDGTLIYKGIWRFLSIAFDLKRANQLNSLPDKDLVDLCPLSNHTK